MHRLITYLIALVWLTNGLLCKVLMLVPRHAAIVARILGPAHASVLIRLIGARRWASGWRWAAACSGWPGCSFSSSATHPNSGAASASKPACTSSSSASGAT